MIITVNKDFRTFKANDIFDLSSIEKIKSITIVGDNGSGKSSLIHALRGIQNDANSGSLYESDFIDLSKNITVEHSYDKIYHLDSVKDNGCDLNVGYDAISFIQSGGMHAKKLSHGQSSLMYITKFIEEKLKENNEEKVLLVFDEIDNGLSLKNMSMFSNLISNLTYKYKCHVLIISHNPFFIKNSIIVYDINKKEYISSEEYIESETGYKITKIK